jgi:hypothetical protein
MEYIFKLKSLRFIILYELYFATQANTSIWGNLHLAVKHHNIPDIDFKAAYDYLIAEQLIQQMGSNYNCTITHNGIKQIETALDNQNQKTNYFPSINDMILNANLKLRQ